MDWLKLFALLVVVASVQTAPEAPKKKIRIHLPQKVKHIHHHKKIYITNHPASSQYAPAFMPSAEGAVAVPTNVALPTVAKVVNPYSSVEVYDDQPTRLPGITSAASKLLPLYHARGYYGPTPVDLEDDYDQQDSSDGSYIPTAFAAPTAAAVSPAIHSKRVKYVKLEEPVKKKTPRKVKSKRVLNRGKQQKLEDEHPVTSFHEQFYSDLDGSGTIRKIKKPQRVEKIIDGDTEHIHTYSEEHIHKVVFDGGSKVTNVMGYNPAGNVAAFAPPHHLYPLKNGQSLMALPSDSLPGLTAFGSVGTPSHLEYYAYSPREVTHDHIFHDHGEIPSELDLTKGHSSFPSRLVHGQGVRFGVPKGRKSKYAQQFLKPTKSPQENDFNYYENIYNPYHRLRNIQKPANPNVFAPVPDADLEELQAYRPIPSFQIKDKGTHKSRNVVPALYFDNGKQVTEDRLQQIRASSPYAVSSTVVHDYKPKQYTTHGTGNLELTNFSKDLYNHPNTYEIDSYASATNIFSSDTPAVNYPPKKGKKKSISTQNISFGGLDHQTTVDHISDSGLSATSVNAIAPTAAGNYLSGNNYGQPRHLDTVSSTTYTIKETSPVHPYYSIMAVKALQGDQLSLAEASNDNFQYAEAPTPIPTLAPEAAMSTPPSEYYNEQESQPMVTEPTDYETKTKYSSKETNSEDQVSVRKEPKRRYKVIAIQSMPSHSRHETHQSSESTITGGKLKYGDKI